MKTKIIIICALALISIALISCKDPREKTVWDYIGHQIANPAEYAEGVRSLHQDLIKHGYMADHDCMAMKCYDNHQNTQTDINRINSMLGFKSKR